MFTRFSEKITENSERIGQQTRPGIKPRTSHLPVLRAEQLRHWWGHEEISVTLPLAELLYIKI